MIEVGKAYGDDIKIRIDSYNSKSSIITATVTYLSDFWKNLSKYKNYNKGLNMGESLTLKVPEGASWWIVDKPKNFPWFTLHKDGIFKHYR